MARAAPLRPGEFRRAVSAILLVREGGFGWGQLWIVLGLAGFAASLAFGALVFAPGRQRVVLLAETEGSDSPAVRERMRRLLLVSRLDLGVLLGIVVVMVVNPASADTGALALAAAFPVAAAALGLALTRAELERNEPRAPAPDGVWPETTATAREKTPPARL